MAPLCCLTRGLGPGRKLDAGWTLVSPALRLGYSDVMATLGPESARPVHPQLGSPASVQTHNLPPNRGLERALEEAAASGVLSLSCRKLKEFPRTAANHDLTDTVEAGRARFAVPQNRSATRPSVTVGLHLWRWRFR